MVQVCESGRGGSNINIVSAVPFTGANNQSTNLPATTQPQLPPPQTMISNSSGSGDMISKAATRLTPRPSGGVCWADYHKTKDMGPFLCSMVCAHERSRAMFTTCRTSISAHETPLSPLPTIDTANNRIPLSLGSDLESAVHYIQEFCWPMLEVDEALICTSCLITSTIRR